MNDKTGKTKSAGWEIGVRKTLPLGVDDAWRLLASQPGLALWLTDNDDFTFAKDSEFTNSDGSRGHVTSYTPGKVMRIEWQANPDDTPSKLQLRILAASSGVTISFHHEKLVNAGQRKDMQQHWANALEELSKLSSDSY